MVPPPDSEIEVREPPVFWVAVAGFSREQRDRIAASLHNAPGLASWRISHFGEADAWLVNGAGCRLLPNGNVRVSPGLPTDPFLDLDTRTADRVAFAEPMADSNLEPFCTVELNSVASMQRMLAEFDMSLRFARAQFALGCEVVERGAALRHGIFHVSDRQNLLAVLDFLHGEVALSPRLSSAQVENAVWTKRPQRSRLPPDFISSTPAQLAWNYVRRSDANLLPPRYLTRRIHYRRPPRVPLSWLRDTHLRILRELTGCSANYPELAQRTGFVSPELDRDLACLFYAGAITTTESKAAPPPAPQTYANPPSMPKHVTVLSRERMG